MKIFSCILLAFVLTSVACGQNRPGRWLENGKPAPQSDDLKSENGFGAQIIVVHDPKAFMEMWNKPDFPNIETAKEVGRNEQVAAFILWSGCAAGHDGRCNSSFKVIGPDGKVVAEKADEVLWKDTPLDPRETYVAHAALSIKFGSQDKSGNYVVTALVSDKNALASFELRTSIEVK